MRTPCHSPLPATSATPTNPQPFVTVARRRAIESRKHVLEKLTVTMMSLMKSTRTVRDGAAASSRPMTVFSGNSALLRRVAMIGMRTSYNDMYNQDTTGPRPPTAPQCRSSVHWCRLQFTLASAHSDRQPPRGSNTMECSTRNNVSCLARSRNTAFVSSVLPATRDSTGVPRTMQPHRFHKTKRKCEDCLPALQVSPVLAPNTLESGPRCTGSRLQRRMVRRKADPRVPAIARTTTAARPTPPRTR